MTDKGYHRVEATDSCWRVRKLDKAERAARLFTLAASPSPPAGCSRNEPARHPRRPRARHRLARRGEDPAEGPAGANPAKAYILVEYKLLKKPFANFPGSRKTMPLKTGSPSAADPRAATSGAWARPGQSAPGRQFPPRASATSRAPKGPATKLMLIEVDPAFGSSRASARPASLGPTLSSWLRDGYRLGIVEADRTGRRAGSARSGRLQGRARRPSPIARHRADAGRLRPRTSATSRCRRNPADKVRRWPSPGREVRQFLGGLVNKIEGVNAGFASSLDQSTNRDRGRSVGAAGDADR